MKRLSMTMYVGLFVAAMAAPSFAADLRIASPGLLPKLTLLRQNLSFKRRFRVRAVDAMLTSKLNRAVENCANYSALRAGSERIPPCAKLNFAD